MMNISIFEDAYLQRVGGLIQAEEINQHVANALRFVIQNVYANMTNAIFFTITADNRGLRYWLYDLMSNLFATWSVITLQLVVRDYRTRRVSVPGQRFCNMIMIDSFKSLEKTLIADYNKNLDSLEYYFIFLQTYDRLFQQEMELIFRYCFDNYWIHCNVMVQTGKGEILIYTYFPYEEQNCFQTRPQQINQFEENRFINEIMFPDKLRNLHECHLKVTTWEVPPFVVNETHPNFPKQKLSGFEVIIMVAISRYMNFTLDMELISIDTYARNQTPISKPLELLQQRKTNITMGYFRRTVDVDSVATPSYVTYYLPLVAVILRKKMALQSLGIFIYPFDKISWALIFLAYAIAVLINVFTAKECRLEKLQIFTVVMGIPIKFLPKKLSKKISFLTMVLSSYILRSVYQSLLFHLFRTNFYKFPPETIDDLIAENYRAICNQMYLMFLVNVPEIEDRTLPLYLINSTNELFAFMWLELHGEENFAAISIYDFAVYYAYNVLLPGNLLQILPINVNDQQIGFYFVKHSYLVERFNDYILDFQQAGLMAKWKEWSNLEYQIDARSSPTTMYEDVFMINLQQLIGIFLLMIFLYVTSIVVFALELLSKRIKKLEKIFK